MCRAQLYIYKFTEAGSSSPAAAWWTRRLDREYLPVVSLQDGLKVGPGMYIVQFDYFPPPPPPAFEIHIFSPTNKFAAGEFIAQKDAFLRPLPPFLV